MKKDDLSEIKIEEMKNVHYAFIIGNLMYVIACTRPDIVYVVGTINRHLANPRKEY